MAPRWVRKRDGRIEPYDPVTEFLIAQARADGQTALYLLTETAAGYFERFGFAAVARDAVPPEVTATRQFADLCPQTAACLGLRLGAK